MYVIVHVLQSYPIACVEKNGQPPISPNIPMTQPAAPPRVDATAAKSTVKDNNSTAACSTTMHYMQTWTWHRSI